MTNDHIGYLFKYNGAFKCMRCALAQHTDGFLLDQGCKVYEDNIKPYSQTCHECGKLVRDGAKKASDGVTPLEIFEKKPDYLPKATEEALTSYFEEFMEFNLRGRYYFLIQPNDVQYLLDHNDTDVRQWADWYYLITENVDGTYTGTLMTKADFENGVTLTPMNNRGGN